MRNFFILSRNYLHIINYIALFIDFNIFLINYFLKLLYLFFQQFNLFILILQKKKS